VTPDLLTLRVILRDPDACKRITPEAANAYLEAHGWQRVATLGHGAEWTRNDAYVLVPYRTLWFDYGSRMCSLVNDLARVEDRSALAVYAELVAGDGGNG
jgi:hypothetical protein